MHLTACEQKHASPEVPVASEKSGKTARHQGPKLSKVAIARSADLPSTSPRKIVSMAPNITEILYVLGHDDRIVGVTRFCDYPPQAKKHPKIGGFIDPDLEAIIAAKSELVIGMKAGDDKITQSLDRVELPYVFFQLDTIEETYKGIQDIGTLLGTPEKAKKLVNDMKERIAKRTNKPIEPMTKVLFVLGHDPLIVAGARTFGDELITLAGGSNLAAQLSQPYPQLDIEKVIELDPDVIIDATMIPEGRPDAEAFWANYRSVSAVKNARIHAFSDPSLLRPGPRLPDALEVFSAAITPPQDSEQ